MSDLKLGLSNTVRILVSQANGITIFQNVQEYTIDEHSGILYFYTAEGTSMSVKDGWMVARLSYEDVKEMQRLVREQTFGVSRIHDN